MALIRLVWLWVVLFWAPANLFASGDDPIAANRPNQFECVHSLANKSISKGFAYNRSHFIQDGHVNTGRIQGSDVGHKIYYSVWGNRHPDAPVAIFTHGGPGLGHLPSGSIEQLSPYLQYFDPTVWRVVMWDQRGCGLSTPKGELRENNLGTAVSDLMRVRSALKIPKSQKALLVASSWGTVVNTAFMRAYPKSVMGVVNRGSWAARPKDLDWAFRVSGQVKGLFPEAWAEFVSAVPANERGAENEHVPDKIVEMLLSSDMPTRYKATRALMIWEYSLANGEVSIPSEEEIEKRLNRFRIDAHYAKHGFFLKGNPTAEYKGSDRELAYLDALNNPSSWSKEAMRVPMVYVHGEADVLTLPSGVWEMANMLGPSASVRMVRGAFHNGLSHQMTHELVQAIKSFEPRETPRLMEVGNVRLDTEQQLLYVDTKKIELDPIETAFLKKLMIRPQVAIGAADIIKTLRVRYPQDEAPPVDKKERRKWEQERAKEYVFGLIEGLKERLETAGVGAYGILLAANVKKGQWKFQMKVPTLVYIKGKPLPFEAKQAAMLNTLLSGESKDALEMVDIVKPNLGNVPKLESFSGTDEEKQTQRNEWRAKKGHELLVPDLDAAKVRLRELGHPDIAERLRVKDAVGRVALYWLEK